MFSEILRDLPPAKLTLTRLSPRLKEVLQQSRQENNHRIYFAIFRASELDRQMELLADCGLQRDIHKRIAEGVVSFNNAWEALRGQAGLTRAEVTVGEEHIGRQLRSLFGSHSISRVGVASVRCDDHDYVLFIEAHFDEDDDFVTLYLDDHELIGAANGLYLAFLKELRNRHVSDWERAVHELASPLDFIYSNSDFLVRYLGRNDLDQEKKLKKLQDFKLISELLINRLHQFRFAFAGTSNVDINPEYFTIHDILMPITHLWYHEAGRKNLLFQYDGLGNVSIKTDKELFQFIMFNLISNAIKYSHPGTFIDLYANYDVRGGEAAVSIKNEGIGISDEDSHRIFELGYRADAAKRLDARGMGIGLAVCRQLTALLGGSIVLEDNSGSSTIFQVTLPTTAPVQ